MPAPTSSGPSACPNCDGTDIKEVIYGEPTGPASPGTTHGGCVVTPEGPDWICTACAHEWQTANSFRAGVWAEYFAVQEALRGIKRPRPHA